MGGGSVIDFGALTTQLLPSFWWLLPLFVLLVLLKSPWFKGVVGEALVNLSARLSPDKNDPIPTEDGTRPEKMGINVFPTLLPKAQYGLESVLTKPAEGHARKCILGGLLFCTGQDK